MSEVSPFSAHHVQKVSDDLQQSVFLFDVFLLNVDRTTLNPNMIMHHGELRCLDYSSAMDIRSMVNGEPYREHVLLKQLKQHPFYREILDPYGFINRLQAIPDHEIRGIVEGMPAEWMVNSKATKHDQTWREVLADKLIQKKQHGRTLRARLDLLRVLKAETAEEAQARQLENKMAFEQKYVRL